MNTKLTPWAVIWDMDGVLIDSAEAHFAAWRRLMAEEGQPYDRDVFNRTFGLRNDTTLHQILGPDLPAQRIQELDLRKEAYYRELIPSRVHLLAGALPLLRELNAAGVHQAIGSSGPTANVAAALDALELEVYFRHTVSGDDVAAGKPAPDIFLLAAERVGVPPQRCVVLEDAPAGIDSARAAGMACVGLASTHPAEKLNPADWVVDSLETLDVPALLRLVPSH